MRDATTEHIAFALTTSRAVSLLLAGYCSVNVERGGDPVPLDLPVSLREQMQGLIDQAHDTDVVAQSCLEISTGTEQS